MRRNPFLAHITREERALLHGLAAKSSLRACGSRTRAMDGLIKRGYVQAGWVNFAGHELLRLTGVGRGTVALLLSEALPCSISLLNAGHYE
ncbi:MAG: hypothetical protein JWM36_4223 [Hyphomicrobiales bacterium]|nr:hypothetical protein [Hyphomicrobiales bacterium]